MEKIEAVRSGEFVPKSMREDKKRKAVADDDDAEDERRSKKPSKRQKGGKRDPRRSKDAAKPEAQVKENNEDAEPEKRGLEKLGKHLGGLIGRKRKMRKAGK